MLDSDIKNLEAYLFLLNIGLAFVIGISLGSFFTALASRILYYYYGPGRKLKGWIIPRFLSIRWLEILSKPSHCMHCKQQIHGIDLWPLVGFLYNKGRCRKCGTSIGWFTLAGEIYPALLLPFLIWMQTPWPLALLWVLFCGLLYISIATDTNFYLLDHENAIALGLVALGAVWWEHNLQWTYLREHIYTCIFVLVLFLLLYLLSGRRGLGFADIILATIITFSLGMIGSLIAIQVASLFAIVYIYAILRDRNAPAPLGTGLALGWMVALPIQRYIVYIHADLF